MSDELLLFEFMELDYENSNSKSSNLKHRELRNDLREKCDPFEDLSEDEFIKQYRLTKKLVLDLCDDLKPFLKEGVKARDLSIEQKVLTALSFYATGLHQSRTGDIGAHSVAQQTVSDILTEVTAALNAPAIQNKFIQFPETAEERDEVEKRFYDKFKFPGVLGCIDCTHVAIIRPTEQSEKYFCKEKQYFSINVQLICDADMQILSVNSNFGGATSDSRIWDAHPVKEYVENLNDSWLLGDSAYPLRQNMLTPKVDAIPGSPEFHYNDMHERTHYVIERTIELLKARFRRLLVHKRLFYQPQKASSIINACAVLHNICNKNRLPEPGLTAEDIIKEAQMQVIESYDEGSIEEIANNIEEIKKGLAARHKVVARLWEDRNKKQT